MGFSKCLSTTILTVSIVACVEEYQPPVDTNSTDIIVVDGFLGGEAGNAEIRITHAVPLSQSYNPIPDDFAYVLLKDEEENSYQLSAKGNGVYSNDLVAFDYNKKYYLSIRMADGEELRSDPILLKKAPEIDSVTWDVEDDHLNIYVTSHDDTGNSRYYRWDVLETYRYNSPFSSSYINDGGKIRPRTEQEDVSLCYKSEISPDIQVGTSKLLTKDVISKMAIHTVQAPSLKLSNKYSVEVRQSILTEEAYNYWTEVKKTTESLGGLFDPMPSANKGNIRSLSPEGTPVIGFISGGEVKSKRLYIEWTQLREKLPEFDTRNQCVLDSAFFDRFGNLPIGTPTNSLVGGLYYLHLHIGYTYSDETCTDCTKFEPGGALERPDFWND